MAKLKGKGTVLQQTISATLTDIAQLTDIDLSGEGTSGWDSTTLDGGVYETEDLTGYANGGNVKVGLLFDPALAGHAALVATISTPATCVYKLKYSDAGPSSLTYTAASAQLDQKIVMKDGLRGTFTMKRTGTPTRA
jgi:hypothetical protein